ncbi:MAG: hypothetical protein U0T84_05610 [Chitinophagales bacterium]
MNYLQHAMRQQLAVFLSIAFLCIISEVSAQQIDFVREFNSTGDGAPKPLFEFNGSLFFSANTDSGSAIYIMRGNDISCLTCGMHKNASLSGYGVLNGRCFMGILLNNTDAQLYETDGTVAGTQLFKTIYAGHQAVKGPFLALGNKLYFNGTDAAHGSELWATDGTAAGTDLFWEFKAGAASGNPRLAINWNNKLWMVAEEATDKLYSVDGTLAGTNEVFAFTGFGVQMAYPVVMGSQLFFIDQSDLWVTDGTTPNTKQLNVSPLYAKPEPLVPYKGRIFFNGVTPAAGAELCVSDGTPAGTKIFFDSDANSAKSGTTPVVFNNLLYFTANHANKGFEPWTTDSTVAGTLLFKDIYIGNGNNSSPSSYYLHQNQLYFAAIEPTSNSNQLFVSNGTPQGTQPIFYSQATAGITGAMDFFSYQGQLFFSGLYDAKGRELYKYGWPTGIVSTTETAALQLFPQPAHQQVQVAALIPDQPLELWSTDGKKLQTWIPDGNVISISVETLSPGLYFLQQKNSVVKLMVY